VRPYETHTLGNRPIAVLGRPHYASSYQGQGTGADILARAIASLPNDIAEMLLIPVHDELVFEVPAEELEDVTSRVEKTMVTVAAAFIGNEIPVTVKSTAGDTWC